MISTHESYIKARESLFEANTEKVIADLSQKTVEDYLENRSIWKELEYYKENGKILGKHRIFSYIERVKQIRSMRLGDLIHLKLRIENNLVKNRARLKKEKKSPLSADRKTRIGEMDRELKEVNSLLNL
jgi:hypothetical protein